MALGVQLHTRERPALETALSRGGGCLDGTPLPSHVAWEPGLVGGPPAKAGPDASVLPAFGVCPPLQGQPGPTHLLHCQAVGASTAYAPAPAPGSSGKPGPRCLTG